LSGVLLSVAAGVAVDVEEGRGLLSREDVVEIVALRRRGWSVSAIARHTGRDRKTIRAWLAEGERRRRVGYGPLEWNQVGGDGAVAYDVVQPQRRHIHLAIQQSGYRQYDRLQFLSLGPRSMTPQMRSQTRTSPRMAACGRMTSRLHRRRQRQRHRPLPHRSGRPRQPQ
jgi:hypothetical protein